MTNPRALISMLPLMVFLCYIPLSEPLVCLSCTEIVLPRDCEYVQTCGSHEKCFVESYVTVTGSVRYNVGCRDRQMCMSPRSSIRQIVNTTLDVHDEAYTEVKSEDNVLSLPSVEDHGDVFTCSQCCDGSDVCNQRGCNKPGFSNEMGSLCYACEQQNSPTDCNKVALCGRDEVCTLTTRYISGDTILTSGCAHFSKACPVLTPARPSYNSVVRRLLPSANHCTSCCNATLCNNSCSPKNPYTANQGPVVPTPDIPTNMKTPILTPPLPKMLTPPFGK